HIRFLSSVLTLRPGDLITTGTPAGVAKLGRQAEGPHRAHRRDVANCRGRVVTRIAGLVCALAISFAACAQSGKVYRIGMLETTAADANSANLNAFLQGLREAGYVE